MNIAGTKVWDWLKKHLDVQLYLMEEDLLGELNSYDLMLEHYGKTYRKGDSVFSKIIFNAPITMTKTNEKSAYKHFRMFREEQICCDIKEEILLENFIKRFPEHSYYLSKKYRYERYFEFSIINNCQYIPKELPFGCTMFFVYTRSSNGKTVCKRETIGRCDFIELLYGKIFAKDYVSMGQKISDYPCLFLEEEPDVSFVLLVKYEGDCRIMEYPQNAIMGIEIDLLSRTIVFYEKKQVIERFHKLFDTVDIIE